MCRFNPTLARKQRCKNTFRFFYFHPTAFLHHLVVFPFKVFWRHLYVNQHGEDENKCETKVKHRQSLTHTLTHTHLIPFLSHAHTEGWDETVTWAEQMDLVTAEDWCGMWEVGTSVCVCLCVCVWASKCERECVCVMSYVHARNVQLPTQWTRKHTGGEGGGGGNVREMRGNTGGRKFCP